MYMCQYCISQKVDYPIENPKAQYISTTKYPGIVIYKSVYTKFLSIDVDTF